MTDRCPSCRSGDPDKVGVFKATRDMCRNEFHCPVLNTHGNPFRYCQYCDWTEAGSDD